MTAMTILTRRQEAMDVVAGQIYAIWQCPVS